MTGHIVLLNVVMALLMIAGMVVVAVMRRAGSFEWCLVLVGSVVMLALALVPVF